MTVKAFLEVVKACLASDSWTLWLTPKNKAFLSNCGLTRDDVKDLIGGLYPSHFFQGPMDDDSPSRESGTIFVFKRSFEHERETLWLYIKLEIPDSDPSCVVLSFHESLR